MKSNVSYEQSFPKIEKDKEGNLHIAHNHFEETTRHFFYPKTPFREYNIAMGTQTRKLMGCLSFFKTHAQANEKSPNTLSIDIQAAAAEALAEDKERIKVFIMK